MIPTDEGRAWAKEIEALACSSQDAMDECRRTCSVNQLVDAGHLGRPAGRAVPAGSARLAYGGCWQARLRATVLAAGWPAIDVRTVALLNGIARLSINCARAAPGVGPTGIQILRAFWRCARPGGTGREMLSSFLLCYDARRAMRGLTPRPLAHQKRQATILGAPPPARACHGLDAAGSVSYAHRWRAGVDPQAQQRRRRCEPPPMWLRHESAFAAALAPDLALAVFAPSKMPIERPLDARWRRLKVDVPDR